MLEVFQEKEKQEQLEKLIQKSHIILFDKGIRIPTFVEIF